MSCFEHLLHAKFLTIFEASCLYSKISLTESLLNTRVSDIQMKWEFEWIKHEGALNISSSAAMRFSNLQSNDFAVAAVEVLLCIAEEHIIYITIRSRFNSLYLYLLLLVFMQGIVIDLWFL